VKYIAVQPSSHEELLWDQYVSQEPRASGYHLIGWRRIVEETFGHATMYFAAMDEHSQFRGALPLVLLSSKMFGRFLVSLPFVNYGGVLADDVQTKNELIDMAIEYAVKVHATHMELRQAESSGLTLPSSHRKVTMKLNLPEDFETLWRQFPSKLRSQIRRGQKEGMSVRLGGINCLDEFYSAFARCMRDLGTPVYSKHLFGTILKIFPEETRICLVCRHGETLAAGFLYGFRTSLEIPWAASDKRFSRLAPNMLLYGSVLEHACKEGFREFDFGRSTPDTGTYRFKEQWGAQPHQLHWYYWVKDGDELPRLNPQNPKYDLAIKVWQRLPLAVANRLGPHIVKYLP
jgi:serine/alanine adding enzyme